VVPPEVDLFAFEGVRLVVDGTTVLDGVDARIPDRGLTAIVGPSGSGKSTLLRLCNRLEVPTDGHVRFRGEDVGTLDPLALRRRVGMVFALPIPLPLTIRQNVTYGPVMRGERDPARLEELVERCLKQAAIWDEVKDRLDAPAMRLSGGQQQRLCIARSLALEPEVILLDNPTSGLDPLSTAKVEASLEELKASYTVVLVPHSVQQAARVADLAVFLLNGELVEAGPGEVLFTSPRESRTEAYVTGRFG